MSFFVRKLSKGLVRINTDFIAKLLNDTAIEIFISIPAPYWIIFELGIEAYQLIYIKLLYSSKAVTYFAKIAFLIKYKEIFTNA